MSTTNVDVLDDVFDDADNTGNVAEENLTAESAEGDFEADQKETGDKQSDGPPPEEKDEIETATDETGNKFIPEHRFRAAIKSVSDELEATKAKLAEYEQSQQLPLPDQDTDPEGHDLHVRMEASKSVMIEMRPDYFDVIKHYIELAETNPLLNEAVAVNPLPAKLAYDIAKQDLRIKEGLAVLDSDDWKKFQQWKNSTHIRGETNNKSSASALLSVPNLNRSTSASPSKNSRQQTSGSDDDLFAGAL